jgi:hypothetical protein
MEALKTPIEAAVEMSRIEQILRAAPVDNAIFPSDNEYGIPMLDLTMQATEVIGPVCTWNSAGRMKMVGTWLFYVDDYKFNRVWDDPSMVLASQCKVCAEVNYSNCSQDPLALILWNTYKKRWLSRLWQSRGVRILVDMCSNERWTKENLIGVPKGWRAFTSRGWNREVDNLQKQYEAACEIAGDRAPLFVVYGGGKLVKDICAAKGWLHIEENTPQHWMTV